MIRSVFYHTSKSLDIVLLKNYIIKVLQSICAPIKTTESIGQTLLQYRGIQVGYTQTVSYLPQTTCCISMFRDV